MPRARIHDLRRRVYLALDQGPAGDGIGVVIDRILVVLIVINLVAVALESVPDLGARYQFVFELIEYISLAVFTLEYGLRLWCAVEHGPHQHLSGTRAIMPQVTMKSRRWI